MSLPRVYLKKSMVVLSLVFYKNHARNRAKIVATGRKENDVHMTKIPLPTNIKRVNEEENILGHSMEGKSRSLEIYTLQ